MDSVASRYAIALLNIAREERKIKDADSERSRKYKRDFRN